MNKEKLLAGLKAIKGKADLGFRQMLTINYLMEYFGCFTDSEIRAAVFDSLVGDNDETMARIVKSNGYVTQSEFLIGSNDGAKFIFHKACGFTSWNSNDVERFFCGRCEVFLK